MPITYSKLQQALNRLRDRDGFEDAMGKMVDHTKTRLVHRNGVYLRFGVSLGLCIMMGSVNLYISHRNAEEGYYNVPYVVVGIGCLTWGLAALWCGFAKWRKEEAEEDAEAIAKDIIKEYPEIAGEIGAEKLIRILTIVPIIESHLDPKQRAELENLKSKEINLQDFKTLEAISQIFAEHLEKNQGDLKMITDAVQNKTMPWELVSQYSQEKQGAHS